MSPDSAPKLLISAIGGDVGQAIVKSIRLSAKKYQCHGCDVEDNEIGKLYVDSFHTVPYASDSGYIRVVNDLAIDIGADLFIPASEQEISRLTECGSSLKLPCGIPVLCQDSRVIATCGDKLNCMRALDSKIPLAAFANGHEEESVRALLSAVGFPLIVKERSSRGSKSIRIIRSENELFDAVKQCQNPLVQEYIDDKFGEYSVGIFSGPEKTEAIAFKRSLGLTGASWYAETSTDSDVLEYAREIAHIISPLGSINIQVRKSSKGVRLLEVNPRFSSLSAARAICGFNDVVWSIDLALTGTYENTVPVYKKIRFKRYISELVDLGDGFKNIPAWLPPCL